MEKLLRKLISIRGSWVDAFLAPAQDPRRVPGAAYSHAPEPLAMEPGVDVQGAGEAITILSYVGGSGGEVVVRVGSKEIKSKMQKQAIEDMGLFVQRAFALKMGYNTSILDEQNEEDLQDLLEDERSGPATAGASDLSKEKSLP